MSQLNPWQSYYRWYLREWKRTGERPQKFLSHYDALLAAYFPKERLEELANRTKPILRFA